MPETTSFDLMRQQVEALFTLDERNQLHLIADTDPAGRTEAPRFFMGRTAQENIWHFRHDLSEDLKAELTVSTAG